MNAAPLVEIIFFFQAEDGIRAGHVTGVQTCALPISTKKRVGFLAYFLGMIIFFNDYVNSVIVGNATKDITAKHKMSREKLAYVIDSTAAPMATIGPVSDWIGFQVSLIAAAIASASIIGIEPYFAFLQSIPWNFYAILCLLAVPMILAGKDFGPMAKAERRAETTGKLIPDGSTPLSSVDRKSTRLNSS